MIEPGALPAEGSVDFVEDIVVTPAPAQGVSDQRVQPDLGGTEKGVESQVELTLLEKPVTEVPVRRGSRVRVQTDRYGS